MKLIRALVITLLIYSSNAFAGSVNINLSNNAAQLEVGHTTVGAGEIQSGFIYNDLGSVLVDTGLVVKGGGGDKEASGLNGGGGVKAIAGQVKQQGVSNTNTVAGIALGGAMTYTFPAAPQFALAGEFFTAVRITSFGNSDRYNEFGIRLEMGPPHAKFFLGYREITFHIIGIGPVSVDQGGYTGVLLTF
jgi:hypothetical protein